MFLGKENKLNIMKIVFGSILTCVLVLCGVFGFDIPVFNFMRTFDCRFCDILGTIFSVKNWLIVSLIVLIVFYIKKSIHTKPKFSFGDFYNKIKASYAFGIFSSVFLAVASGAVLKFVIGRARPIFYEALGMTGFFPFTYDSAFHSMPSGHAMASFAGLVMIGMLAPRWKWFLWGLATAVGVSRVCAGFHWPSDVIFGAFWGVLCAEFVRAWMARTSRK